MTDATTITTIYVHWPLQIRQYELPSVGAGAISDMFRLEIPRANEETITTRKKMMIKGVKIDSDSTSLEISFFNKSDGVKNTINEFMRYIVDMYEYEAELAIPFISRDVPERKYIYCKVTNNGNISGPIHIELHMR